MIAGDMQEFKHHADAYIIAIHALASSIGLLQHNDAVYFLPVT
jgi:hypothetical protein